VTWGDGLARRPRLISAKPSIGALHVALFNRCSTGELGAFSPESRSDQPAINILLAGPASYLPHAHVTSLGEITDVRTLSRSHVIGCPAEEDVKLRRGMAPECSEQSSDQTLDYGPWPVHKFDGAGPSRRSILVVGVRIGFVSVRSHQIGDTPRVRS
jgi:hypothetical protein